jgi:hypothetical protein
MAQGTGVALAGISIGVWALMLGILGLGIVAFLAGTVGLGLGLAGGYLAEVPDSSEAPPATP